MLPCKFSDRLTLGPKPLQVSPVCIGLVPYPEFVLEAFEAGINFFFVTADMHWPAYEDLRKGLTLLFKQGVHRDEVAVAGTAYVAQQEFLVEPFLEFDGGIEGLGGVDVLVAGGSYEKDNLPDARIAVLRQRTRQPPAHRGQAQRALLQRLVLPSIRERPPLIR